MPEIDADVLLKADKGLAIAFIICICIVNILLIIKTAFKKGFMYSAKNLTIISLALGDIFLAVYCLVNYVRVLFESTSLGCSIVLTYNLYQYCLIHCVYGIGLIVLAVELMIRYKRRLVINRKLSNILIALLCSAIPWILGLVIVLPLTMVGIDWETCTIENDTLERGLAKFYVSVIIPAGLAVIICVIASCVSSTPRGLIYQRNTQDSVNGMTSQFGNPKAGVLNDSFVNTPTPLTNSQQVTSEPPVCVPVPDYEQEQLIVTDGNREKIVLVITSIVFCLCVVPLAALVIHVNGVDSNDLSVFASTILVQSFYWLFMFRSIITPLIWLVCSSRY